MEYYVYIDIVEKDQDSYNHLFRMQVGGKEYLISWTGEKAIGVPATRTWITWSKLECTIVPTVEHMGAAIVFGKVNLCTAFNVRAT